MRAELQPPGLDEELPFLIADAFTQMEAGDSPTEVAARLAAGSGYETESGWLDDVFGSLDAAEAAWALRIQADPELVRRVTPTAEELIEVVEQIMPTSPGWDPDLAPWWAAVLQAHVPHPHPVDLVFNPPSDAGPGAWTAERIVAHALAHNAAAN